MFRNIPVTLLLLFLIDNCVGQESWKSLAGESDDEPSWDAKTAFKNTRNPFNALQAKPPLESNETSTKSGETLPITSFKQCQDNGGDEQGPRAWWHGWCFMEEELPDGDEVEQCSRYRFGRKVYIDDKKALKSITQLLEQWERNDEELVVVWSVADATKPNDQIGQWYIEGEDGNGKCKVYDWNTKSTTYTQCGQQNLRVLCQYPVCRDRTRQSCCEKRANHGRCERNRSYMESYCQETCVCQESDEEVTPTPPPGYDE